MAETFLVAEFGETYNARTYMQANCRSSSPIFFFGPSVPFHLLFSSSELSAASDGESDHCSATTKKWPEAQRPGRT